MEIPAEITLRQKFLPPDFIGIGKTSGFLAASLQIHLALGQKEKYRGLGRHFSELIKPFFCLGTWGTLLTIKHLVFGTQKPGSLEVICFSIGVAGAPGTR